eukprot:2559593-Heterocapsa_arctica.AAC.1
MEALMQAQFVVLEQLVCKQQAQIEALTNEARTRAAEQPQLAQQQQAILEVLGRLGAPRQRESTL